MNKLLLLSAVLIYAGCKGAEPKVTTDEKPTEQVVKQAAQKAEEKADVKKEETPEYKLARTDLGSGIYMLVGRGGNLGVSTGSDGVFVIDDQFAQFAPAIIEEIGSLSEGPIRFVANTHYHGDHTGGNEAMRETGASIVAHDNVRVRMSTKQENKLWGRTTEPTAPGAWPTITFSETMTFHFNDQTIDVVHVPKAHTDGDSIIYFRQADVLHMGDNFFNGMFPYIDVDGGGNVSGMIAALNKGLELGGPNTKIIPGHGPLSTPGDMKAARDRLADIQSRVKQGIDSGQSMQDMIDGQILSDYSEFASFIDEKNMIKIAYRSQTGQMQ